MKVSETQHEEILELLPWLVNETLEGKERLKVLNHLSHCPECQLERDRLQELGAFVEVESDEISAYQPAYNRLLSKINAAEAERQHFRHQAGIQKTTFFLLV